MFIKVGKTVLRFIGCQAAIAALALVCAIPLWALWTFGSQKAVCGPAFDYLAVAFLVATGFELILTLVVGVNVATNAVKWLIEAVYETPESLHLRRGLRRLFGWD